MKPPTPITGNCHLCGEFGKLSFEHIPPKRAYNDRPLVLHKFEEFESGYGTEYAPAGRGGYTLCEHCNNFTGGTYGPAFVEWCYQGFALLNHTVDKHTQNYHGEIYPLRVLKQVATIFFSVNGPQFRNANPALEQFVLDKDRKGLSRHYQFYVFWYGGGSLRQIGVAAILDTIRNRYSIISEFVHPPFGYLLSFQGELLDRRPEGISHWANFEYDEAITFNHRLPVLPTHWMMPGDYRTTEQIAADEARNSLA